MRARGGPLTSHRLTAIALTATPLACNALFGIDDLQYVPPAGAGGTSSETTSSSGTTSPSGSGGSTSGSGGEASGGGNPGGGGSGPASCVGLPEDCGPMGDESCCKSPLVVGGSFDRSNNPLFPATVSDFRLDRFEVTVGRFRRFVNAYPSSAPAPGDGAHPAIPGSGWDASDDAKLPGDATALMAALDCGSYTTYTDQVGGQEHLPINCLTWELAFAFCAWDGGRLPTEAEWNYAAAAGAEQRLYPWGSAAPTPALAVAGCSGDGVNGCTFADILDVGSTSPGGDGKLWLDGSHADLAGNLWEWTLDVANFSACCNEPYAAGTCIDCAHVSGNGTHVLRGGCFSSADVYLETRTRYAGSPPGPCGGFGGVRCARLP